VEKHLIKMLRFGKFKTTPASHQLVVMVVRKNSRTSEVVELLKVAPMNISEEILNQQDAVLAGLRTFAFQINITRVVGQSCVIKQSQLNLI